MMNVDGGSGSARRRGRDGVGSGLAPQSCCRYRGVVPSPTGQKPVSSVVATVCSLYAGYAARLALCGLAARGAASWAVERDSWGVIAPQLAEQLVEAP